MPLVDMSLDKLYAYEGVNPCPSDFDAFWEKSLSEMNAIDPAPRFIPAAFACQTADCFDLYFTSTKNATVHARFVRPKHIEGKTSAILKFHGLSGRCDKWSSLVAYAAEGHVVASMDCRGQGGLSEDVGGVAGTTYSSPFIRGIDGPAEGLLCRDLFLDTAMLARIVMGLDYVDKNRVGCTGGSQGGGLSIACASLVPAIKMCAPIYPYLSDYKRVWDMDLAKLDKGAYKGIPYYFRYYDPRHEHEQEFFEKLGYIDIQYLAPRIRAKVLMGTGLMDTVVPPSTQFAMYNKITSEKQVLIYPDFGHESLGNGEHDDLVFEWFSAL